jgi:hypothetical protein
VPAGAIENDVYVVVIKDGQDAPPLHRYVTVIGLPSPSTLDGRL